MEGSHNQIKNFAKDILKGPSAKSVNLREASRFSGYTTDYIGQLIRGGKIQGTRKGRVWFIDLGDLEKYLKLKENRNIPASDMPFVIPFRASGALILFTALIFIFAGTYIAGIKGEVQVLAHRITSEMPSKIAEFSDIVGDTLQPADDFIYGYSYDFGHDAKMSHHVLSDASYNLGEDIKSAFVYLNDVLYAASFENGRGVKVSYAFASNYLYTSSFSSAQTVKASYLAASVEADSVISAKLSNISDIISVSKMISDFPEFSTASIVDPLTFNYKSINISITNLFGDTYINVVKTVIPGYSLDKW